MSNLFQHDQNGVRERFVIAYGGRVMPFVQDDSALVWVSDERLDELRENGIAYQPTEDVHKLINV